VISLGYENRLLKRKVAALEKMVAKLMKENEELRAFKEKTESVVPSVVEQIAHLNGAMAYLLGDPAHNGQYYHKVRVSGCGISFPFRDAISPHVEMSFLLTWFILVLCNSGVRAGFNGSTMPGAESRFERLVGRGGPVFVMSVRWDGIYTTEEEAIDVVFPIQSTR